MKHRNPTFKFLWGLMLSFVLILPSCGGSGGGGGEEEQPGVVSVPDNYFQGCGAAATGGKGGAVYYVSNLKDYGASEDAIPGSLRAALMQNGNRTIIFKVSGTIRLKRVLKPSTGNFTIAGQTAPGDGITLADYPLVLSGLHNVVVQFIRFRLGDQVTADAYDAFEGQNNVNVMIDHCSMSWSVDECASFYGNTNFTMQWCIIAESLKGSSHPKGNHGYGGIWGGTNATFHHNLLADHDSRNPRFDHDFVNYTCRGPVDFVNNVVFNWGGNNAYGGESTDQGFRTVNFENNYYRPGTNSKRTGQLLNPTTKCGNASSSPNKDCYSMSFNATHTINPGKFYVNGNVLDGSSDVTADNSLGVIPDDVSKKAAILQSAHFPMAVELSHRESASDALTSVLACAGASKVRDAVDTRVVKQVRGELVGKIIDSQSDVGGWPELASTAAPLDSDFDGIPDVWEDAYSLNKNDATDARKTTLDVAHVRTNLEIYLYDLVKDLYR
ncbi:MAG: pectate lyase [Paludibacteraceae bacterium]|nr:pectate lyase [Paludibacteraceae bacterium]